jgi:hypothetical protein
MGFLDIPPVYVRILFILSRNVLVPFVIYLYINGQQIFLMDCGNQVSRHCIPVTQRGRVVHPCSKFWEKVETLFVENSFRKCISFPTIDHFCGSSISRDSDFCHFSSGLELIVALAGFLFRKSKDSKLM